MGERRRRRLKNKNLVEWRNREVLFNHFSLTTAITLISACED